MLKVGESLRVCWMLLSLLPKSRLMFLDFLKWGIWSFMPSRSDLAFTNNNLLFVSFRIAWLHLSEIKNYRFASKTFFRIASKSSTWIFLLFLYSPLLNHHIQKLPNNYTHIPKPMLLNPQNTSKTTSSTSLISFSPTSPHPLPLTYT